MRLKIRITDMRFDKSEPTTFIGLIKVCMVADLRVRKEEVRDG